MRMIPYDIKLKKNQNNKQLVKLLMRIHLWEPGDQSHHVDWLKTK